MSHSTNAATGDSIAELKAYYAEQGVSFHEFPAGSNEIDSASRFRFVRLHPRFDKEETLALLTQEIGSTPVLVPWLDLGFYGVPADFSLSQSPCYRQGRIYGQDVSSGAAVAALLTNQYDDASREEPEPKLAEFRVLDLCCAPGLKLCAMADYLRSTSPGSNAVVVGVDISSDRLAICKRVLGKYQIVGQSEDCVRIQLYCNDGTTFASDPRNLVFDSSAAQQEASQRGKRKRMNKSARARERKRLKQLEGEVVSADCRTLFDRVLVDAECSTDGSIKHVQKRIDKDQTNEITDSEWLEQLVDLQRRLAASGFRLLKPGGCMVYSTCSLSRDQNENVIAWLLQEFVQAEIIPVDFASRCSSSFVVSGAVPGTVRFLPCVIGRKSDDRLHQNLFGGGFFLAKIRKAIQ